MDTKITRLRNLLTPMKNYFAMVNANKRGETISTKLLANELQKINESSKEIWAIIAEIPNDACESDKQQTTDKQLEHDGMLGVEILDSNEDFRAYLSNAHESNEYFQPLSQNKNPFFCIASVFSYGNEFAQNICDAFNSILVNLRESQKGNVCENVIHHTCKHFDINTACTYCKVNKFESKY